MELKILEKKKGRLVFELANANHTLCNALRDELWNDKQVTVATYAVRHPLTSTPRFILETAGEPMKALQEASKRLQKKNKELEKAFAGL